MPWQKHRRHALPQKRKQNRSKPGWLVYCTIHSKLPELNKYFNPNPASVKTLTLQISLSSSFVYLLFCKQHWWTEVRYLNWLWTWKIGILTMTERNRWKVAAVICVCFQQQTAEEDDYICIHHWICRNNDQFTRGHLCYCCNILNQYIVFQNLHKAQTLSWNEGCIEKHLGIVFLDVLRHGLNSYLQ